MISDQKYKNSLVILGPHSTGKTRIAMGLARRLGGEMIPADKFYLFSGFLASIGLSKDLINSGIPLHMYSILKPMDERMPVPLFVSKTCRTVKQILERNNLPIVEGCSFGYCKSLIEENEKLTDFKFDPVVGVAWSIGVDKKKIMEERVDNLFEETLVEVKHAFEQNYNLSYVIKKGVLANPAAKFLQGEITMEETKNMMVSNMLKVAEEEMNKFLKIPNVHWIEYDPRTFDQTVGLIENLVVSINK